MANKTNKKVMSIAITPELHENLAKYSKRRGQSASSYICSLVEKAMKINVDEEPAIIGKTDDVKLVPFKIPKTLIEGDKEELRTWLKSQVDNLVDKNF